MSQKSKKVACDHTTLRFSSTQHSTEIGYSRATPEQRVAATTPTGVINKAAGKKIDYSELEATFPAPLILPDDDLALDPRYPPQSLRSWILEKYRNQVTLERRTIYLAAPPAVDPRLGFVKKWTQPRRKGISSKIKQPIAQDVLSYLEAFYHGLPVKMLSPDMLSFTLEVADVDDFMVPDMTTKDRRIIGLDTKTLSGCKGIRTRSKSHGEYTHQMNLNDLLDAAIWVLPDDAYALLLLVDHDLYEDEEDEFVCGRAYGGSRVAVISTARYNPGLDREQGLEREHAWPASHCEAYLEACCDEAAPTKPSRRKKSAKVGNSDEIIAEMGTDADSSTRPSSMQAAVSAHKSLPSLKASTAALSGLWLGRVCRTASHELGHCFGMDHCVYYACSMQGSASIIEDARQPPYLCPVDLAKVLKATEGNVKERYQALLAFCDRHEDVHIFAGYGAWIRGRLEELVEQE
jgi:archaemetzincin